MVKVKVRFDRGFLCFLCGAQELALWTRLAQELRDPPPASASLVLGYRHVPPCPPFYVAAGGWTQVQQALYCLSHLGRPRLALEAMKMLKDAD